MIMTPDSHPAPTRRARVRHGVIAALVSATACAVALVGPAATSGSAAPTPKPSTTTLPTPRATVDPALSIGGPRLASMGVVADLPAGVPAPPKLRDVSWLLADLDTGAVIAAKAPHARLLPASTLKTLTALTLIPRVPATERVVATQADANADGTRVGIVPGLPYTAGNLFQALLMASGNDAAYALARAGGGREATVALMNERAAYLGAHDTVAKDPSGLDAPGQTSSAYDLALIGREALQLKEFRAYVATKQANFPGRTNPKTKKRALYKINNHNKLLYNYAGTIGVKNGYTEAAHRTFISAVSRGGKRYLLTEMYGLDSSWRPQAAMYDWAFRYGSQARPVGELVAPGTVTTPPSATPSPAPSGADAQAPQVGQPGHAAAAAALPSSQLLDGRLSPWVGVGGLAAALLLVALLAGRRRQVVVRQRARRRRH
jgi:serine-type D-Ala-D-Ala carboxypeptidase (penicillin-binding protein 5/6)